MNNTKRTIISACLTTPIIMTLISQPVFGANCLSNVLSGNLSDPKRGNCKFGIPIDAILNTGNWGIDSGLQIKQTELKDALYVFPTAIQHKTLWELINNGNGLQRVSIGALVNCSLAIDYILNKSQLLNLLQRTIPVPHGLPLKVYLESTLRDM